MIKMILKDQGGKYGTKLNFNFSRINGLEGGYSMLNDNQNHTPALFDFSL